jgi:hypothetical protein
MDRDRKHEEQRLERELRKLQEEIAAMQPQEREKRVAALRTALIAGGAKLTAVDELVLQKFKKGELGLEGLSAHFHGRI